MTEPSLFHNRRARGDCSHRISSYTIWDTQLDENNSKWVQIRYLDNFFQTLWFCWKVPSYWHFRWHTLPFHIFSTLLWSWEPERLPTPFLIPPILLWLWRCGFHLVQIVKLLWDIQNIINILGDTLVTTLDLFVFPNIALTTVFHVHRLKQILLTCELFLPERLPSGATMINRRWCYNY